MEILYFIVLGLVQGLTEFLPVSSSGHLVLINMLWGNQNNFLFVSIILHVATLLSVIVVLWKQVKELLFHPFKKQAILVYIATIPTVIIVLFLKSFIKATFSGAYLSICFMMTAVILAVTTVFAPKYENHKFKKSSALIMGIAQGFAVFPGISRSGSTICAGLICGENRKDVTKFSFLMSIPIIIASLIMEVYDCISANEVLYSGSVFGLLLAFVFAFISGVIAIKFMLRIVEKGKYWWFSVYLVLLSILMIILL